MQAQRGVESIALIETPRGVQACEAISAVPGLTGVMVGPFDLSVALGHGGDVGHADVQAAIARVLVAARDRGVSAWMPVFAADGRLLQAQMQRWTPLGVRRFVIGADKIIAGRALADYLAWAARDPAAS